MRTESLSLVISEAILKQPENGYLRYHAPRYNRLLEVLRELHLPSMTLLDVGRSPFAEICKSALSSKLDLLGFEADATEPDGNYYQFDLNNCRDDTMWRADIPSYDIIIFSEVIEHLPISPTFVLAFLHSLLKPGGRLILQTPNAVVLHKRLQLLLGYNPYSLIATDPLNPAHFREYTLSELKHYSEQSNFSVQSSTIENYFDYRYTNHALGRCEKDARLAWVNRLYNWVPKKMKPGITMVLSKNP